MKLCNKTPYQFPKHQVHKIQNDMYETRKINYHYTKSHTCTEIYHVYIFESLIFYIYRLVLQLKNY